MSNADKQTETKMTKIQTPNGPISARVMNQEFFEKIFGAPNTRTFGGEDLSKPRFGTVKIIVVGNGYIAYPLTGDEDPQETFVFETFEALTTWLGERVKKEERPHASQAPKQVQAKKKH